MDAMNRRQSLTWTRSLGAALGLALALGLAACGAANAGDDEGNGTETGTDDTADGIGTSPSEPQPQPQPPPAPAAPAKRRAVANDPTGCPAGTNVVLGTSGSDVLESTAPDTCFVGVGGDDVIFARGARDVVIVGEGAAYVAARPDAVVLGHADVVSLDSL